MKLALFRDAGLVHDDPRPLEEWAETNALYVRVSDYIEVEFPNIKRGATAADIACMDERIGQAQALVTDLIARKNEMLAITHEVQA